MKRKDFQQIKSKSSSEITDEIGKLEKELVSLKMKLLTRQEKNVRIYKTKRQDLARLKTIQREQQLISQS